MFPRNVKRGVYRAVQLTVITALVSFVGLAYYESFGAPPPHSQAALHNNTPSLSNMFDYQPTLLVVGDSYAETYPDLVADKMHWSRALDEQNGGGFVRCVDYRRFRHEQYIDPSPLPVPFKDRLDHDAATYHADYVLIDGGRTDLGDPPGPVVAAADEYIKDVHSRWPNAKIIIMLPATATRDVAANYGAVAEGLRRTAESVGAYVIDPVEQGWYRDADVKPLLQNDGVHLTNNGEIYYANKIIENLQQMRSTS
jgi:GDSL-like Lipase/Acylhydrolase family